MMQCTSSTTTTTTTTEIALYGACLRVSKKSVESLPEGLSESFL